MLIKDIGEFGLIQRIKKQIKFDSSVIVGPGDDCAVVEFSKKEYLLFTCDMLIEGIDFTRKVDPRLIGRKALAVSLSDIAACGGKPRYALVSLGLPKRTSLKIADGIIKGILDLAEEFKVNIVGGDLSRADKITLDVSVTGVVKKPQLVLRSGAKKGDVIFVSGPLGGSLKGKHLDFTPRVKEAEILVNNFKLNSMIDISDGLVQDLNHILESSSAGAVIYEELIPISKEASGLDDALYSGEDFELLFTASSQEAKKIFYRYPQQFNPIGEIMPEKFGLRLMDRKKKGRKLPLKGFIHF